MSLNASLIVLLTYSSQERRLQMVYITWSRKTEKLHYKVSHYQLCQSLIFSACLTETNPSLHTKNTMQAAKVFDVAAVQLSAS